MELPDTLKPFITHGVVFSGRRGNQAYGTCPFSGKEDKFYVNIENQLWDSKSAGISGNLPAFLQYVCEENTKGLTGSAATRIVANRSLPLSVLKEWEVGWNGQCYTIPVRNERGHVTDVRRWRPGDVMKTTSGCKSGLLGAHRLKDRTKDPVFICEGEWDAMALSWLFTVVSQPGVVVAVPGAGTFKQEWVHLFAGRNVYALYDHDNAGELGEKRVHEMLKGAATSLAFIHWPTTFPTGFDVRDWVVNGIKKKGVPDKCWKHLQLLFMSKPRMGFQKGASTIPVNKRIRVPTGTEFRGGASYADVERTFKKWLFMKDTDAVKVCLACVLSNKITGDPLWMFLVSPPGGSKTETLQALTKLDDVFMTSSLTPHALVSGAVGKDGYDPSLVPQLDGKILVIKDFTSILSKREQERDEIFGILRDAYDGKCGKVFGNGITRDYTSRFSILAAVTPSIYVMTAQHQSLGERFLKYLIGENLRHDNEEAIISRAISNINQETEMREELSDAVASFIMTRLGSFKMPVLGKVFTDRIVHLAQFAARMRGSVPRDRFHNDIMISRPSAEVGSRLGKQLAKLALSLAIVNGNPEVGENEYRLVRKVAMDTTPQRIEDLIRVIYDACPTVDDAIKTKDLAFRSRYSMSTATRLLQDLHILDIITRVGEAKASEWTLTPYIRSLIKSADLYRAREREERGVVSRVHIQKRSVRIRTRD